MAVVLWQVISHQLFTDWLLHIGEPPASDDYPMAVHRTARTSGRIPTALVNLIRVPAEDLSSQKSLQTLIIFCSKKDFVAIADNFCTKTFPNLMSGDHLKCNILFDRVGPKTILLKKTPVGRTIPYRRAQSLDSHVARPTALARSSRKFKKSNE